MNVAYQGTAGSYSEAALLRHFGKDARAQGCETFEEVFEAVVAGQADAGILPFENTVSGSIARNYDLLLEHDVRIIAEVFQPIRHHLLGIPGVTMEDITDAHSHLQALEQCRPFLQRHGIKPVPEYDTAGAAKYVKEQNSVHKGAIASALAAELYGLQILSKDVSCTTNTTKFFVFVRQENVPGELKREKTSIAFKTKHFPGALVHSLERFSKNDINLTKLESRPIPDRPWEYVFYADFLGGTEDKAVKTALGELEATSLFIKILGSYPLGEDDPRKGRKP